MAGATSARVRWQPGPERAGEMIATPSPTYLTRAITISRRRTRRSTRRQQDKQKEECKEPQEGGQNGKLSAGAPISAALDRRRDAGLNPPRSMRVYLSLLGVAVFEPRRRRTNPTTWTTVHARSAKWRLRQVQSLRHPGHWLKANVTVAGSFPGRGLNETN